MNVEQNKEVATPYIEVYLLRSKVLGHNSHNSFSHIVLLLMSRCFFTSVVSCQSPRKKIFSELRAESGIFIASNIGLVQLLWILLPFYSHVLS